jgi:hypothetical protein
MAGTIRIVAKKALLPRISTGLFKEKYKHSKIILLTIEHMAMCYTQTEGRTLKVIFTPYKHSM